MSKLNTKNWIKLSPVQYLCKRDRQPRNNCTRPNCRCCLFPVLSGCCSAVSLQILGDHAVWSHVATASAGQAFPGQTIDFSFQRWQQCCLLQVWAVPPCKELMGPRSPCFLLLLLHFLSYLGFVGCTNFQWHRVGNAVLAASRWFQEYLQFLWNCSYVPCKAINWWVPLLLLEHCKPVSFNLGSLFHNILSAAARFRGNQEETCSAYRKEAHWPAHPSTTYAAGLPSLCTCTCIAHCCEVTSPGPKLQCVPLAAAWVQCLSWLLPILLIPPLWAACPAARGGGLRKEGSQDVFSSPPSAVALPGPSRDGRICG